MVLLRKCFESALGSHFHPPILGAHVVIDIKRVAPQSHLLIRRLFRSNQRSMISLLLFLLRRHDTRSMIDFSFLVIGRQNACSTIPLSLSSFRRHDTRSMVNFSFLVVGRHDACSVVRLPFLFIRWHDTRSMIHILLLVDWKGIRFRTILKTPRFPPHHYLFSPLSLLLTLHLRHAPLLGTTHLLLYFGDRCDHSIVQVRRRIRICNCDDFSRIDGTRTNQGGFKANQTSSLELLRQPILLIHATKHRHDVVERALDEERGTVRLVACVRVSDRHHVVVFADRRFVHRKHVVPISHKDPIVYILRR